MTAFHAHAKRLGKAWRAYVIPKVKAFAKQEDERHDAKDDDPGSISKGMREIAKRERDSSGQLPKVVDLASKRVVLHSQNEFDRLGIDITDGEPDLGAGIEAWRREILERLSDMEDDEIDKIEELLKEGGNRTAEALAADIEEQIEEVTASRASFIARDSVLKLNAKVTRERQQAAKIEQYIWTTSNDERVRDTHAELEGEVCDWDDPPEINDDGDTGHPGDDYQCRCIAFPILPELDEDAPDEGDDEDESEDDE